VLDNTKGLQDLVDVVFTAPVDANASLVVGSVTTSAGTVTSGNTAGDTSVRVEVSTVFQADSVTITFAAQVHVPIPAGVTQLSCQGTITLQIFPTSVTDDPDTADVNDPTITPLGTGAPSLAAQKVSSLVVDLDGNGVAGPGETLEYSITLTNTGDDDAAGVAFTDTPGAHTILVAGSVTTTQGTVTTGNQPADSSVAVAVGPLDQGGGTATVVFRVQLDQPLPPEVEEVSNQGSVSAANAASRLTDDPRTPAVDDPTVDPILVTIVPVEAIPTLGPSGAVLLALALAGFAARRLHRRAD
jgi:uncharacterized repeat protein (TIGR01451 family)